MRKHNYLILLLLALITISCSKRPNNQENIIKIGVILPISGSNSHVATEIMKGMDLAIDIVNHKYDLNMITAKNPGLLRKKNAKLQLIYKDFGDDRQNVVQIVDELVKQEKVNVIVGSYLSLATAFASERAELYGIPFFNFESTSPTLTNRGLKCFFRTSPDDEIFTKNFFSFLNELSKTHKFPKKIVLVYENSIWGTNVAQAEMRHAKLNNYEIVAEISYDYLHFDADLHINTIKAAMPAIIMHASYDNDAIEWITQYQDHDINPIAIIAMNAGFTSPNFIKELGKSTNYIISRECWAKDLTEKNSLAKAINTLFVSRYSHDLNGNSARAFTGTIILADILDKSKSLNYEDIIINARETNISPDQLIVPWKGVIFNKNGQNNQGSGIIVQIQNQKYYTIWPTNLASKKVVWPLPHWSSK